MLWPFGVWWGGGRSLDRWQKQAAECFAISTARLVQEPQGTAPRTQPGSRAGNDTTLMQTQDMSCPGGARQGNKRTR